MAPLVIWLWYQGISFLHLPFLVKFSHQLPNAIHNCGSFLGVARDLIYPPPPFRSSIVFNPPPLIAFWMLNEGSNMSLVGKMQCPIQKWRRFGFYASSVTVFVRWQRKERGGGGGLKSLSFCTKRVLDENQYWIRERNMIKLRNHSFMWNEKERENKSTGSFQYWLCFIWELLWLRILFTENITREIFQHKKDNLHDKNTSENARKNI